MARITELLKSTGEPSREAYEAILSALEEMDALLDEVAFLRVENAELRAIIRRYEEDDGK